MSRTLLFLSLTLLGANAIAQAPRPEPILPDQLPWQSSPALPGAASVWVVGEASASDIYAQRVKLRQGALIAPHTHSDTRFSVVLSGTIYVGFGTMLDESQVVAVPAGALYVAPAGVPHYVWARDGDAEYQESGIGPTATTFVPNGN